MSNRKPSLARLQQRAEAPSGVPDAFDKLRKQLRHALDPIAFAAEELKFQADPWQCDLMRCGQRQIIVNIARQSGKSWTAAAIALHRAVFKPKALVLLVAPTVPQATELRLKIDAHRREMMQAPGLVEDNKRSLEFDNGSRIIIVAADADTVRGYSAVDLIVEDESAFVPDGVFSSMEPMLLVSKGQHVLLSTPNGFKGHFAEIWHEGGPRWQRFEVKAWDNPRADRQWLEDKRDELTRLGRLWQFHQEYECSFIAAAQGLVYPYDPQKNASPLLPMDDRLGWQFVLGIDYGFTDSTAFCVLGWQKDDPHVYVVESFKKTGLTAPEAAEVAFHLTRKYPFARMVGDAAGFGKGYVEEARRRFRLPLEPAQKQNKRGYIELMVSDLRTSQLKVFPGNDELLKEWQLLPWDEERELPADGYEDHISDACLYAWRATYAYLEEVRAAAPLKGSPAALAAEAEQMLEDRIAEVTRPARDWWDEGGSEWPLENILN